jgi:hypothetical protein
MDNLEQVLAADSQMMVWPGQDRMFDPLRSERRFVALLKKLRLSRYPQTPTAQRRPEGRQKVRRNSTPWQTSSR